MIEFVLATALKQGLPLFVIGDLVVAYFLFKLYKTKTWKTELARAVTLLEKDTKGKVDQLNQKIDDKVQYGKERIEGLHTQMKEINDAVKTTQRDIKEILVLISRK